MAVLQNVLSLNLDQHCLFCLVKCKSKEFQKHPSDEQLRQVLLYGTGPSGATFRDLFWKLLSGSSKFDLSSEGRRDNDVSGNIKKEVDSGGGGGGAETLGNLRVNDDGTLVNVELPTSQRLSVSVCKYCLETIDDVRTLYMELERIQMLLLEQICNLQKIIRGSHHHVREMLRRSDIDSERPLKFSRECLEKLSQFQETVIAQKTKSARVPYVVLERVTNLNIIQHPIFVKTKKSRFSRKRYVRDHEGNRRHKNAAHFSGTASMPENLHQQSTRPSVIESSHLGENLQEEEAVVKEERVTDNVTDDSGEEWTPSMDMELDSPYCPEDDEPPSNSIIVQPTLVGQPPKFSNMLSTSSPPAQAPPPQKRGRGRPRLSDKVRKRKPVERKPKKPRRRKRVPSSNLDDDSCSSSDKAKSDTGKRSKPNHRLYIRKSIPERDRHLERKIIHHHIYRCEECGKTYFKRVPFLKHQRAHMEGTISATDNPPEAIVEEMKACRICGQSLPEAEYNSHMLSHEQNIDDMSQLPPDAKLHSCTHKDCIKKFQYEENLKIHMEIDHDEISSRSLVTVKKCDVCNVCYDSSSHLLEHVRKCHTDSLGNMIYCPICGHVFTTDANLIIHMHSHATNTQQICYKCPVSDRVKLPKRADLLRHFREYHALATSGKCSICQEEFEDIYWLKVHLQKNHSVKEQFVCSYCGQILPQALSFMRHYTSKHKGDKSHLQCEDCAETFSNPDKLLRHRIMMHGAAKLSCEVCGVEFVTRASLKQHSKIHTDQAFKCQECGKHCSSDRNLRDHMASHSDQRPFTCDVCGAGSKTFSQLKAHMIIHAKSHTCGICGRQFSRAQAFRNHMKLHTGEVTPCPFCGYEFHSEKSLKRHLKAYHVGQEDKLKPLYPPQKRRGPRTTWKDDDGNTVFAKTGQESEESKEVKVQPELPIKNVDDPFNNLNVN